MRDQHQRRLFAAGAAVGSVLALALAAVVWSDGGDESSASRFSAGIPRYSTSETAPGGNAPGDTSQDAADGSVPPGPPGTGPAQPYPPDGATGGGAPPPVRAPDQPASPVRPSITVTQSGVPSTLDLTAEGTLDWVHWGLNNSTSLDRKRTGSGAIADRGGPGGRGRYDNNPQRFTWRDGSPTGSASNTPTGVYSCGVGNGFQLQVAAGPAARTLRFYAGVWQARGRLELSLSTGGATATARLENRGAITTARFTIAFRAPAAAQLVIRWVTEASFNQSCGNVDMQAATLQ